MGQHICQSCAMPFENVKPGTNANAVRAVRIIATIAMLTANSNGLHLQWMG